jgi:hypothetical protein
VLAGGLGSLQGQAPNNLSFYGDGFFGVGLRKNERTRAGTYEKVEFKFYGIRFHFVPLPFSESMIKTMTAIEETSKLNPRIFEVLGPLRGRKRACSDEGAHFLL